MTDRTFDQTSPDAELDPPRDTGAMTDLSALEQEIERDVSLDPLELATIGRDGWGVVFDVNLDIAVVERIQRRASRGPRGSETVDAATFNSMLVVNRCIAITKDGRRIVGTNGKPLTFDHDEFMSAVGALDERAAVKRWYGLDSRVAAVANAILEEAGYGDVAERVDPTMR